MARFLIAVHIRIHHREDATGDVVVLQCPIGKGTLAIGWVLVVVK